MATLDQTKDSPLARYNLAWDTWLTRAYAINWEVAVYTLILIAAIVTRFWDLGARVMSHDESLHTYYSWKLYDAGDFQHTPLMHGPVLFHAVAFFYFLFGDSDFTARIYPAVLGILIVMFPYLFRRWLGKTGAVLASVGLLLSPMITYYSRYIREDIPNIFYLLIMVYAIFQYIDGERPRRPIWLWVFSGSMLLMLASKETGFMYIAILGSYLALYWGLRILQEIPLRHRQYGHQEDLWQPPLLERLIGHGLVGGVALVLGFFAAELIYYWQFASFSWLWVIAAVAAVLFVRLIPLLWDLSRHGIGLNLFLALAALLGTILVIFGSLTYQGSNSQLNANTNPDAVFVPPPAELDRAALEDRRLLGGLVALVGGALTLFNLGGLMFTQLLPPADQADASSQTGGIVWMLNTGGVIALAAALLGLLKVLTHISFERGWLLRLLTMIALFVVLESVGVIRTLVARRSSPGIAQMLTEGLARGKSAFLIIIGGAIIGGVLAVHGYGVLDIIKPDDVWVKPIAAATQSDPNAAVSQPTDSQTEEGKIALNTRLGNALLVWLGVPIMLMVALIILVAIVKTPASLPIPWADVLGVILVALLVGGILKYAERNSLEKSEEPDDTPIAIDPNAESAANGAQRDTGLIIASMLAALVLAGGVVVWRLFLPYTWDFLNRQPAFDVLIMMGTLILPWLSAYPIFLAGYQLDAAPLPNDTVRVSFLVTGSIFILAAVIGLSWNWKVWLIGNAIFLALFLFFFTTVFTNGAGIGTGMVGSLGYWLEQQGVRRGSQPQYYYTLIQLPVYEFMPMILAGLAGVSGLAYLFGWRSKSLLAEREDAPTPPPPSTPTVDADGYSTQEIMTPFEYSQPPFWARPYDHAEEQLMRDTQREWVGSLPFMPFVGYWAIIIVIGLTMAGEKMPWLTTHIAVPLILAGAWYAGRVIEKIKWDSLRKGGWAVLLFLVPIFVVALLSVLHPLVGGEQPFRGQGQAELSVTNEWLAALLVLVGVSYFLLRLGRQIGWGQMSRVSFAGVVVILAALTGRASFKASFQNFDYATEYLVYAHGAPAVKMVMDEVDYFADRTNEGYNMRVAYDDDSSWPLTWYMRHYNAAFFAGKAESLEQNPGVLDGARIVIVGSRKNAVVERILGDQYYRFDYIRLWWPMQEYFHLTYDRVANIFASSEDAPAAPLYRDALWDIWWDRDYRDYGRAQCFESRLFTCESDANPEACQQRIKTECESDDRYAVNNWPVSDRLYMYVDKEIAAQIWDAGIGGASVSEREPQSPIDAVYRELEPQTHLGGDAGLLNPRGVSVDSEGKIYVADTDNSRIVVLNPDGTLHLVIGMPSSAENTAPGTLLQPWGLEVADDGTLYVADTWNHRVQVFSPNGEWLRSWGTYGVPDQGANPEAMWGPRDLTIDLDGNILVADTGNKRVRVYTPDGVWLRDIGFGGSGLGQLDEPVGLAVNPINGELYVADTWNRRISVFSKDGVALRVFDVPMWYDNRSSPDRPYLAISPDGTLLAVSDMNATGRNDGPRVVVFDLSGNPVLAFNAPETDFAAGLYGARLVSGIEFAPDGSLLVVDTESGRLLKFAPLPVTSSISPVPLQPANSLPSDAGGAGAGGEGGLGQPVEPAENLPFSMQTPLESEQEQATEQATEGSQ